MSKSEDELFSSSVVPYRVLVLCVGNTCRSIIFEAILNSLNKANIDIYSAGFKVKEDFVNERTLYTLNKHNIPSVKEETTKIKSLDDVYFDKVFILDKNYSSKDITDLNYNEVFSYNIDDPLNNGIEAYEEAFIEIEELVKENFLNN